MNTSIIAAKATLAATNAVFAKVGEGGTVIGGEGGALSTLFNNVYKTVAYYASFAGLVALAICGIIYLVSSDQQSAMQAKKWAFRIFIGLAIVLLASVIINGITDTLNTVAG